MLNKKIITLTFTLRCETVCKPCCFVRLQHALLTPLHVAGQGWNQVLVELWTHARDGLTENDFIIAAKLNKLPKEDLLRKAKKKLMDSY